MALFILELLAGGAEMFIRLLLDFAAYRRKKADEAFERRFREEFSVSPWD